MNTLTCPDPICEKGQIIIPEKVRVGDVLECPECAAEVEVIKVDPVEVKLIEEEK